MSGGKKPKVLFVEDTEFLLEIWRELLAEKVEMIIATTIGEALWQFENNGQSLSAIVLDGCIAASDINTLPLARQFRASFQGPMIAMAGAPDHRQQLLEAGCSHECRKEETPKFLLEVLRLS
jgi:CheY-like chemotaxis protein